MWNHRDARWTFFFMAPDGAPGAGGEGSANPDGQDANNPTGQDAGAGNGTDSQGDENAEIARLKAELVKQKAAIDKATKEASEYKKQLRTKQSDEEIAAEEKKAADEAFQKEIEELRREVAKTKAVKAVMSKLGTAEDISGRIAECLYGAEDVENALTEIQKAWAAKEKALRLEFGKLHAPGIGGDGGEDEDKNRALATAKEFGQRSAASGKSIRDGISAYVK